MYEQVFDPVSDSLGLSSIFAALPLITCSYCSADSA